MERIELLARISQIAVALGILNVWLLRSGRPTSWRGGGARSLREEFEVYGLPAWFMRAVGSLKILLAILLIAGLWVPAVTRPAALAMGGLMLGAIAMHLRVRDPWYRSLPALSLLVLCLLVAAAQPGASISS
jgi:uncharacterized membrane protein YphA (DoxX/SURF4 family)